MVATGLRKEAREWEAGLATGHEEEAEQVGDGQM